MDAESIGKKVVSPKGESGEYLVTEHLLETDIKKNMLSFAALIFAGSAAEKYYLYDAIPDEWFVKELEKLGH